METWEFIKELFDPESIIKYGGLVLLLVVVFAETGLLIGFFLPGDSLIFVSGMVCSTQPELLKVNIVLLIFLLIVAAVIGNISGYAFGKRVGPALFKKKDSLIFKKKYLETTRVFYARHGGKALILGRFLPIIRTFAPILAGVIEIGFRRFMFYNVVGAFGWIVSLCLAGFYLGKFAFVQQNVGWIVIFLIIITLIPVAAAWRGQQTANGQGSRPGEQK
ncbi:MAG TPA: VTT domain-containing protein [Bacteroidia bacterium]|nr:VTT domain-containing protein [Bacteroidia bacterium]